MVERFWQEARAIARLAHPHIVTIHDFGEDKGFTYIVMEHLTGGTLAGRMGEKFPLDDAIRYISPLAEALDYAHDQGIVHRDIKPANVLLDDQGSPKLSDFGIARILEGRQLTAPDSVPGTPEYMAPEQALGRSADHRSDNYALGIIVYQMVLGQTPFRGDTPTTTLMAHIHQAVPRPSVLDPETDPRLEPILLKALAKNPDDRFQTAGDLAQALELVGPRPAESLQIDSAPTRVEPRVEMKGDTPIPSAPAPGEISLDQARVIAIQHAREDTDFYGQEYGTVRLAWEVTSQEDTGNYYEIRLAYRPSGRFRGQPGVEQFTIGKTGNIEVRQILDEPVVHEPPKGRTPPTKWLAAAAAAILAVVVGGVVVLKPFAPSPTVEHTAAPLAAVPAVSDTPAPPTNRTTNGRSYIQTGASGSGG